MRIRRRPPGQPLAYLLPTDPYPAPPPAPVSRDHPPPPPGDKQEGELHLHPATKSNDSSAADLGDAARSSSSSPLRRPALPPQDGGAVERERSRGLHLLGAGAQLEQQQQASSLENGLHRHVPEPATNQQAGVLLTVLSNNGVGAAVAVVTTTPATTGAKATKQQEKKDTGGGGGTKRAPRGPGILLEGSRCSRKNGRGWRCSQPTLVGYALCQYHLGKGRMKSGSAAATVGRGPGQLGRTEHSNKQKVKTSAAAVAPATAAAPKVAAKETSAAAVAPATASVPKADLPPPPPPPSVQHC